jgi:hypothetical protein
MHRPPDKVTSWDDGSRVALPKQKDRQRAVFESPVSGRTLAINKVDDLSHHDRTSCLIGAIRAGSCFGLTWSARQNGFAAITACRGLAELALMRNYIQPGGRHNWPAMLEEQNNHGCCV